MDSAKLTKKQKKALAFRSGGKKKDRKGKEPEQLDLPDGIDDGDGEHEQLEGVPSKKRKRQDDFTATRDDAEKENVAGEGTQEEGEEEPPKKKKRQRGGKSAGKKRTDDGSSDPNARRFLLFVGNIADAVTEEQLVSHFTQEDEKPIVRLRTPKAKASSSASSGGESSSSKSSGATKRFAFVEFQSVNALRSALKLHREPLAGRRLNVELTAGGAGNSEARKAKLGEKRARLLQQRTRKTEAAGATANTDGKGETIPAPGAEATPVAAAAAAAAAPAASDKELKTRVRVNKDGSKTRDRRRAPKVDKEGSVKERKRAVLAREKAMAKSSSGANMAPLGRRSKTT